MASATSVRASEPRTSPRPTPRPIPDVLAAVDLGSNSFHMVVARHSHGQLAIIDRLREMVRLAAGVAENGRIDKDVAARALACLERFGQRLRDMHADGVRVVGTNALRLAHKKQAFLERAREALGHPIEIIAGMEEARLIYAGVAHTMPNEAGKRLVVDVGGGSSEYATGNGPLPDRTVSCEIGAVRLTEMLPLLCGNDGVVDLDTIEQAREIARKALAPVADFPKVGHVAFVGGSATTVASLIRGKRTKIDQYELSRSDLQRALVRLCALPLKERKALAGMKPQRADILPAGIIVLETVLDLIGQDRATATTADLLLGYLLQQVDRAGRVGHDPGWNAHGRSGYTPAH